jgi:hypothetical protein
MRRCRLKLGDDRLNEELPIYNHIKSPTKPIGQNADAKMPLSIARLSLLEQRMMRISPNVQVSRDLIAESIT